MIRYQGDKSVIAVYRPLTAWRRRTILAMYDGARLFWEAITSCFGRGAWINGQPWSNVDGWKNNV